MAANLACVCASCTRRGTALDAIHLLQDNEALLVVGSECFSQFSGYASSFRFKGDYRDGATLDDKGRRATSIVAIDAQPFARGKQHEQYEECWCEREATKAYVGFMPLASGAHAY